MSNAFVIIKMCHVHNQWYDISCATLYIYIYIYIYILLGSDNWTRVSFPPYKFAFACFPVINVTITKNDVLVTLYVKYFKSNFAKTPQLPQNVTWQRICTHLQLESKFLKSCIFPHVRKAVDKSIGYNTNTRSTKVFFSPYLSSY